MVRTKIVRIVANFSIIFYIFWDLIKNIETDGCAIIRVLKFLKFMRIIQIKGRLIKNVFM